MKRLVFISDTHNKHKQINLPEGDILIHGGDITSMGYEHEVRSFIWWFQNIKNFDYKLFIAGNHDLSFENKPDWIFHYINNENLSQSDCDYLEDNELSINNETNNIKIYGSPWQPEFCDWGFNLPRNGDKLKEKWDMIPIDTDILITHGPPQTILDSAGPPINKPLLGCELLLDRVKEVKPKIHVFGHIHSARGVKYVNDTLFVNASVLNEQYQYVYKPIVIDYDFMTNEWEIVDM